MQSQARITELKPSAGSGLEEEQGRNMFRCNTSHPT